LPPVLKYYFLDQQKSKLFTEQLSLVQSLSDHELNSRLLNFRKLSLPQLTPYFIDRWYNTKDDALRSGLYQFFLDTKMQEELGFFVEAIENKEYVEKRSELIAVLWQSSLDASECFDKLVHIALNGDLMTIIEVSTVIDSFDMGFEEQVVLDNVYQIGEALEEENDEERAKLLSNLQQIISELYAI